MGTWSRWRQEKKRKTGTGVGTGTGAETKIGTRKGGGGREEEICGVYHIRKEAQHKIRHCHSERVIVSVYRRWRLHVACSSGRRPGACPTM